MGKYNNIDCPICNKPLENGEDIVICDQCGAPYHKNCVAKEKRCIYVDLHRLGESWTSPNQQNQEKFAGEEAKKCSRCGTVNPVNGLFCEVCGNSLNSTQPQTENFDKSYPNMGQARPRQMSYDPYTTPFGGVNPDEKIDDVEVKDIAIFIGQNTSYFIPKFKQYQDLPKTSTLNLPAFIFTGLYFFYRKMYSVGALLVAISVLISIPSYVIQIALIQEIMGVTILDIQITDALTNLSRVFSFLNFGLMLFCGFYANKIYKKHCITKIKHLRETFPSQEEYKTQITKQGSISRTVIWVLLTIYLALQFLMVLTMMFSL